MSRDVRIRQIIAGQKIRKILGLPPQTDRNEKLTWAAIPAYFCSKGFMRYSHMLEEAQRFMAAGRSENETEDERRLALLDHLAHEAKTNPKYLDNKAQYNAYLAAGRKKAVARDALLQQLCPYCGHPLPCYTHDIGKVSLDGKGGLVHHGYDDSDAA